MCTQEQWLEQVSYMDLDLNPSRWCWSWHGEMQLQLFLPMQWIEAVQQLAHYVSLTGYLGRQKIAQQTCSISTGPPFSSKWQLWILHRKSEHSSWMEVVCTPDHLTCHQRASIQHTMDNVGPLPRNLTCHKYILVICNYDTPYRKVVSLHSIHGECIAEQLIH